VWEIVETHVVAEIDGRIVRAGDASAGASVSLAGTAVSAEVADAVIDIWFLCVSEVLDVAKRSLEELRLAMLDSCWKRKGWVLTLAIARRRETKMKRLV